MDNIFNNLTTYYNTIFQLTVSISENIKNQDVEKIQSLLDEKQALIEKINALKKGANLSFEQQASIKSIINKIQTTEEQNISEMQLQKQDIKNQLAGVSKNRNLISAYKVYGNETKPRVFDARE